MSVRSLSYQWEDAVNSWIKKRTKIEQSSKKLNNRIVNSLKCCLSPYRESESLHEMKLSDFLDRLRITYILECQINFREWFQGSLFWLVLMICFLCSWGPPLLKSWPFSAKLFHSSLNSTHIWNTTPGSIGSSCRTVLLSDVGLILITGPHML